jgi:hypothetical protein
MYIIIASYEKIIVYVQNFVLFYRRGHASIVFLCYCGVQCTEQADVGWFFLASRAITPRQQYRIAEQERRK